MSESLKTRYPVEHHEDGLLQSSTIGLQVRGAVLNSNQFCSMLLPLYFVQNSVVYVQSKLQSNGSNQMATNFSNQVSFSTSVLEIIISKILPKHARKICSILIPIYKLTFPFQYPVRAKSMTSSSDELSIKCTAKIGNAYWQSVVQKTRLKRHGRMLESRSGAGAADGEMNKMLLS